MYANCFINFNRDLFNASKDNIANAELNDTLKTKTKELALSKIVEGRLLIQVNKMKQDMEKSKDSYDSAQSKLTTIMESYQSLKTDCQRYEILKSAMKKVYESDEKFCSQGSDDKDSFSTLDEDEICDVIRTYIFESFKAKTEHHSEMKKGLDRVMKLYQRNVMQNKIIKTLTDKMKAQNTLLTKMNIGERDMKADMKSAANSVINQTKLINTLNVEIKVLKSAEKNDKLTISSLKEELELLEKSNEETEQVISDLKEELDGLQKMAFAATEKTAEQEKQIKVCVEKLKAEHEQGSQMKTLEMEKKNKDLQKHIEELRTELIEIERHMQKSLDSEENLKSELSNQKQLCGSLKEENILLEAQNNESKTQVEELQNELREIEKEASSLEEKCAQKDVKDAKIAHWQKVEAGNNHNFNFIVTHNSHGTFLVSKTTTFIFFNYKRSI